MSPRKVLLTGIAGFIGSHILPHLLLNTDWNIIGLDRLSYAGNLDRIAHHRSDPRLQFVFHDFRAAYPASVLKRLEGVDYIIHNGAESHVDRSIDDPLPFVESNVLGTMHTLDAARKLGCLKFIYTSTDEVFGPAPEGIDFSEDDPIRPSNPYSAAKAGGEALVYAYSKSYGLPAIITRTMNIFGERQGVEKYIPMVISKLLHDKSVTVHGNDKVIGSRKWLHARNQADALLFLLKWGHSGEFYNIAGDERNNLEIAFFISKIMDKPLQYELVDFHNARLGHDRRYSLDDSKLRGMGWSPQVPFIDSLKRTVEWTIKPENRIWLEG